MQIHALSLQETLEKKLDYVHCPTSFGVKSVKVKRLKTTVKQENGTVLNFNTTLYFEKEEWAAVFSSLMKAKIDIIRGYSSILAILEVAKTLNFEKL